MTELQEAGRECVQMNNFTYSKHRFLLFFFQTPSFCTDKPMKKKIEEPHAVRQSHTLAHAHTQKHTLIHTHAHTGCEQRRFSNPEPVKSLP